MPEMLKTALLLSSMVFLFISMPCMAAGEVLKIDSTGTEYCAGYKPINFSPKNDFNMWLSLDSATSATIYSDAGLANELITLEIESAAISKTSYSFSAFYGDVSQHLTAIGTFAMDKNGLIKSVNATVIMKGVIDSCYSKSTISGKRIN